MSQQKPEQTEIRFKTADNYREGYANSVQVRMSVWDFQLVFGTMHQSSAEEVKIENFQAIYLSPQQAKALLNVLAHNVQQYEQTFGQLELEPRIPQAGGPVH